LFRDYYYHLPDYIGQQAKFKQVKFKIKSKIFLLDSTTISLCLSLLDWAHYKTSKGAVKVPTLLDYEGNLPAYAHVSDGKTADNKAAYEVPLVIQVKGSVIVADRYYNDFLLLNVPAATTSILGFATKTTWITNQPKKTHCLPSTIKMYLLMSGLS
jgi:hypothetical protein